MNKVYDIITDKIIEQLEAGKIPWKKPWNGAAYHPKNLISKKDYSGVNLFLLSMAGMESPYFVTYKQAAQVGGNVKKGERGFPIVFWKKFEKKENAKGEKTGGGMMLRYYTVFNLSQCENVNPDKVPAIATENELDFQPLKIGQALIDGYIGRPSVTNTGNRACYAPLTDAIKMPLHKTFQNTESYYSTLFHEFVHSTGHNKRLARPELMESNYFGSHDYSKEELVAEFGAAFLCADCGIDNTLENSAAYIQGWLKKLKSKDNLKWIIEAASKAQKAVNYIKGDLTKA